MAGRKPAQEQRRQADQTWLRPPRAVVERIEALLELGKSNKAVRNHSTLVDYDISEEQIADIRDDYEAARDWEVCVHEFACAAHVHMCKGNTHDVCFM